MPPTKSEDMTTKWSCVFKHYPLCNSLNELFINYCSKWQTSENSLDIVQHPALIITTFYVQQTKTLWIISIYSWLTLRTFPGNQNKKSIVQYYCHCMHAALQKNIWSLQPAVCISAAGCTACSDPVMGLMVDMVQPQRIKRIWGNGMHPTPTFSNSNQSTITNHGFQLYLSNYPSASL